MQKCTKTEQLINYQSHAKVQSDTELKSPDSYKLFNKFPKCLAQCLFCVWFLFVLVLFKCSLLFLAQCILWNICPEDTRLPHHMEVSVPTEVKLALHHIKEDGNGSFP